jgi:uncharacterized membrane protein
MSKLFAFLKTTAIGGLVFLLPLAVIAFLVAQVVGVVGVGVDALDHVLPIKRTPAGITVLIVLVVAALLILCFLAGVIARRAIGRRAIAWIEKKLLVLFPRYGIVKQQLAGNLGPDAGELQMQPVVVRLDDHERLGFEVDRAGDGPVTVYLPGSPDPWSGHVVLLEPRRVKALDADFPDAIDVFEHLGRGAPAVLGGRDDPDPA